MIQRAGRYVARVPVCVAVVIGLSVTPVANAAPPVIPPGGYGFGDGAQMTWIGADDANRELDAVAKTSATWFRVLIPWSQIETAKGQYNCGQTDLLVNAASPAIKAVQPNSTVILAGLSRLPGQESPPAFLTQMYAAGAKGSFDAAAAHPYVHPSGLAANPDNGWSDVPAMHDVMVANG